MNKLVPCTVVLLNIVLTASIDAQRPQAGTGAPNPPFLELTELYPTVRVGREPDGVFLDRNNIIFEADIFPHFVLANCVQVNGSGFGWPCISVTAGVRARMEGEESAPIDSPSFMPRLNFQWLSYGKNGTATGIGFHLGHHSNGQAGCLFRWESVDGPCVRDNERLFSFGDLESGAAVVDAANGSFSVDYFKLAVDHASYRVDGGYEGYRIGVAVEAGPETWMDSELRDDIYPTLRVHATAGLAFTEGVLLCPRYDVMDRLTIYRHRDRNNSVANSFQLTCLFGSSGAGYFVRYRFGKDDYNSSFFLNTPENRHRIQVGFTINRFRVYGTDAPRRNRTNR